MGKTSRKPEGKKPKTKNPSDQPPLRVIAKKSTKISKSKAVKVVASKPEQPEVEAKENLPTVESDVKLKEICEKTAAVEKEAEAAELREEAEPEKAEQEPEMAEQEPEKAEETREKVKVKRKDSLIKKKGDSGKGSGEKSFMSLDNPEQDNKEIKTPSYSYKKNRGIIYMSHIPHGFFEQQMRDFFTQFGTITNLRLGRSKKSGKSKGYAFVEFKYDQVAKVVAETMNNYLMFNKIVKCEMLPKDKCNPAVFMGKINSARPPQLVARRKTKKLHNMVKSELTNVKRSERMQRRVFSMEKKLEKAGISYKIEIS